MTSRRIRQIGSFLSKLINIHIYIHRIIQRRMGNGIDKLIFTSIDQTTSGLDTIFDQSIIDKLNILFHTPTISGRKIVDYKIVANS